MRQETLAGGRQLRRPLSPLQQFDAKPLFEIPDRAGKGRLLDGKARSDSREMQFLGNRHKVSKMTQIQLFPPGRRTVGAPPDIWLPEALI
jgi:hypothetical protein